MAKLKIMSIELVAAKSERDAIIDHLQRKGAIELSEPEETDGFSASEYSADISATEKQLSEIKTAKSILGRYAPQKKPLTAMLEPRKDMTVSQFREMSAKVAETLDGCSSLLEKDREIADCKADIIRLRTEKDALLPWVGIDIPLVAGHTKSVAYIMGSFKEALTREDILTVLARELPENAAVEIEVVSSDINETCIAVFCLRDDVEEVEQALRSAGFSRAADCEGMSPQAKTGEIDKALQKNADRIRELSALLGESGDMFDKLCFAEDYLSIRKDRLAAFGKLPQSNRVFCLSGYAAKHDAEKLKAHIEKHYDAAVIIRQPSEDEDVPVILSNNFFSAPLEGITGMYSLPSNTDIDPTGIMAFFYYFFFGMMLSDAGYGMLMVLLTGGILLFKKNLEKKMKNTLKMYLFCGLSTTFWGAMYGSWFGDLINVVRSDIMGLPKVRLYLWLEPVEDLMQLLVYCFIFGLVHLFVGVGIKAYTLWRAGDKFGAFSESVPTYLTILGTAPIFFNLFTDVPEVLSTIGTPMLIVGLVLVVLTAGRSSKSIGGKIGGGLYGVYNLVGGYLGDVLSYARLLALGLATGVIGQVINMLGVLPSAKPLKIILLIVVGIAGHIANLGINLIGAYVHTNRLQFVELFGKFYEGGGRAFVPFEAKTEYYKFKEEN